jgi:hypothetical protein
MSKNIIEITNASLKDARNTALRLTDTYGKWADYDSSVIENIKGVLKMADHKAELATVLNFHFKEYVTVINGDSN